MSAIKPVTLLDVVTLIALFTGPAIAVILQRWRDSNALARDRKLFIFKTLMATRGTLLSTQHVEALNRIELEFASNSSDDKAVRAGWNAYLDVLNQAQMAPDVWNTSRVAALVELLHGMGKAMGYDLDKTAIKNGAYIPRLHGQVEEDYNVIRQALRSLAEGKSALPVELKQPRLPVLPSAAGGGPAVPIPGR